MQVSNPANRQASAHVLPILLRSWLSNRLVLATVGTAITVGGLASGWSWLSAIGVAPIILAVAPCAVMCAFGMCMMGKMNRSSSVQQTPQTTEPPPPPPAME